MRLETQILCLSSRLKNDFIHTYIHTYMEVCLDERCKNITHRISLLCIPLSMYSHSVIYNLCKKDSYPVCALTLKCYIVRKFYAYRFDVNVTYIYIYTHTLYIYIYIYIYIFKL